MKLTLLISIGAIVTITSCSLPYTYFSKDLYENTQWSQEDIMRIQFYLSNDIILTRSMNSGETSIAEGQIKIKNGERVEYVVIKAGTPGVLVMMPTADRFAISFEEKDNDAYLMFGPNPKYEGRFALLAQEWDREYGIIHYRDQVYTADAGSAFSCLMVDLRNEGESKYETHNPAGRTVKQ